MPVMRCTEPAFIVLIKRATKQCLYELSFGYLRLDKELVESLDERLTYIHLDSELNVTDEGYEAVLISDKIDNELRQRSKLS